MHLEHDEARGILEFDDSDVGERLRRYQASCDRTLLRVLETLRRRRREAEKSASPGRKPARPSQEEARRRTRWAGSRACWRSSRRRGRRTRRTKPSDRFTGPAPSRPRRPDGQGRNRLSTARRETVDRRQPGPARPGGGLTEPPGSIEDVAPGPRRTKPDRPAPRTSGRWVPRLPAASLLVARPPGLPAPGWPPPSWRRTRDEANFRFAKELQSFELSMIQSLIPIPSPHPSAQKPDDLDRAVPADPICPCGPDWPLLAARHPRLPTDCPRDEPLARN